jgi:hypothetical protein
MLISKEDQAWLKDNCQVWKGSTPSWVKRAALKTQVIAGKAKNDWWVVAIDLETGAPSLICPYCATGVKHRGVFH